MIRILCLCFILLTASQLFAETYSWVDDAGVWNFTEDFNRIPKKYRKSVERRGDTENAQTRQKSPVQETNQTSALKSVVATDKDNQLYNGKSYDAWRKELDAQEAELKRLEQRLEQMQSNIKKSGNISRERQSEQLREYESLSVEYKDRYKIYSDLLESARKAGLTVEMKK